jgi:hypothetical protein
MTIILGLLLVIALGFGVVFWLTKDVLGGFSDSLSTPGAKGPSGPATMEPNWKPLEEKMGKHRADFLYVGRSGAIHIYKNVPTRMYLYLDEAGRCYVRGRHDFQLGDFNEEWGKITAESGIDHVWKVTSPSPRTRLEMLLMHQGSRLLMRLVAAVTLLKWVIGMFLPSGKVFSQFDWWIAISYLILPAYLLLEIKRRWNHTVENKAIVTDGILFSVSLAAPALISVAVILGWFVGLGFTEIGRLFK